MGTRVQMGKRNAAILAGDAAVDVADWDDEELLAGRRRDKNGNFSGRPPKIIPRVVYVELIHRMTQRAETLMAENLPAVAEALTKIATDTDVDPELRAKVGIWLMEHFLGKAPASVEVSADVRHRIAPWEQVLQGALVTVATDDVVDAEVVDEE